MHALWDFHVVDCVIHAEAGALNGIHEPSDWPFHSFGIRNDMQDIYHVIGGSLPPQLGHFLDFLVCPLAPRLRLSPLTALIDFSLSEFS